MIELANLNVPWTAYGEKQGPNHGIYLYFASVKDATGHNILRLTATPEGAAARLLVAAPDMLTALHFIADRQNLMFAECADAEQIILVAREAISKA